MEYITTANVLLWLLLTAGFFLMFVSYWLAAAALFPRHVARCSEHFGRPVAIALVGALVVTVPIFAGVLIMNAAPVALKWIGFTLVAAPVILSLVGSAGLAWRIGSGLAAPEDAAQPWRRVLRGGSVLALTFLLPILGQLLVIPLILAAGAGASVFSWFGQRRSEETEAPATADTEAAFSPLNPAPPLS